MRHWVGGWIVMVLLQAYVGTAYAGPCTVQIQQLERQVTALRADPAAEAGQPSAPQSVGAQLHHQPTPGSVESAESTATADADRALARARKADATRDGVACAEALGEARQLYGL